MPCLYETTPETTPETNPGINFNTPPRFQNQGKGTISAIIGSYKSICTKTINKLPYTMRFAWQPRFHDHVIRNDIEFNRIRVYIMNNPKNWDNDVFQFKKR
jgi:hypothetical protein